MNKHCAFLAFLLFSTIVMAMDPVDNSNSWITTIKFDQRLELSKYPVNIKLVGFDVKDSRSNNFCVYELNQQNELVFMRKAISDEDKHFEVNNIEINQTEEFGAYNPNQKIKMLTKYNLTSEVQDIEKIIDINDNYALIFGRSGNFIVDSSGKTIISLPFEVKTFDHTKLMNGHVALLVRHTNDSVLYIIDPVKLSGAIKDSSEKGKNKEKCSIQ